MIRSAGQFVVDLGTKSVAIMAQAQAPQMAEWVLAAANRVGGWATAIQPVAKELPVGAAVSSQCAQDIWRTVAVCFGAGEDFLKQRQFVEVSIFTAGFLCGLVVVCFVLAVVSLRDSVYALLAHALRGAAAQPSRAAKAALQDFEKAGLWKTGGAVTAEKRDGPRRESRFTGGR